MKINGFSVVVALLIMGVTAMSAQAATLAAQWDFNEGSGSTAADSGPHGHDLLVPAGNQGNEVWVSDAGGSHVSFNGAGNFQFAIDSNSLYTAADDLDTLMESAGSAVAWIRNYVRGPVIAIPRGGSHHSLGIGVDSNTGGQLAGSLANNGVSGVDANIGPVDVPSDSDWHMVALTWVGGSHANFYLDGVAGAQAAIDFTPELSYYPGKVGGGSTNWYYLESDVDQISLYSGELSANEIQAMYAAGKDGVIPEPASLALLGMGSLLMLRRRQSA